MVVQSGSGAALATALASASGAAKTDVASNEAMAIRDCVESMARKESWVSKGLCCGCAKRE